MTTRAIGEYAEMEGLTLPQLAKQIGRSRQIVEHWHNTGRVFVDFDIRTSEINQITMEIVVHTPDWEPRAKKVVHPAQPKERKAK